MYVTNKAHPNRAAGVAILEGTFKGHVLSHNTDHSGRLVILEVNVDQSHYILVNLYATSNNITYFLKY